MSLTHVVSIGNSDDKLTQSQWNGFVDNVYKLIRSYAQDVHFVGFTASDSQYQSATFVFVPWPGDETLFTKRLSEVLAAYNQDSAAIVVGPTTFVGPSKKIEWPLPADE